MAGWLYIITKYYLEKRWRNKLNDYSKLHQCYWIKALRKYVTFVITIVAKTEIQTIETISYQGRLINYNETGSQSLVFPLLWV